MDEKALALPGCEAALAIPGWSTVLLQLLCEPQASPWICLLAKY